jgi:hypothetical protein
MQNFGEERIMEMQVHGFAHVIGAGAMQAERNSCLVDVGIETCRPLEGSDIGLIRIFNGNLGLVGDRFGHRSAPFWSSHWLLYDS